MPLDLVRKYIKQEIISPGSTDENSLSALTESDIHLLVKDAEDQINQNLEFQGALYHSYIGVYYYFVTSSFDKGVKHTKISLEILDKVEHPKKFELQSFVLNLLGICYFRLSELLLSIEHLEKALEIVKRHKLEYMSPVGNLIGNYMRLGKIDLAINLVETDKIAEKIPKQHPYNQLAFAGTLALLCRAQNDLEEAMKIVKKYIDLADTKFQKRIPKDTLVLYFLYFEYLTMLFEIGKIEEANKFHNDYIKTNITINNEDIKQVIKISEGLVLINSDRLKDKIRGQIVVEEALGFSEGKFDQQRNHPYLAQFGILSLIELMLDEVKLYGKIDPINDIYEMLNYLTVQSNKTQNYQNLTSVKIIESGLKILSGDLNQANEILEEALVIASEMKLINLKEQVMKEQKHLLHELDNWKELLENNAEISLRLGKLKLVDYIKYAKQIVVEKW